MSAVLEFVCRPAVEGYRIVPFDQRKVAGLTLEADFSTVPSPHMTDDERAILEKWGLMRLEPDPGDEPETLQLLEPQSDKTNFVDLFLAAPGLFRTFAATPRTREGVKAFADQFGLLGDGTNPESLDDWKREILR